MSRIRGRWAMVLAAAFLAAGLLSACDGAKASQDDADGGASAASLEVSDASWEDEAATAVTLADGGIEVAGEGAAVDGNTLRITAAGTYVLAGTLTDGQVYIEAGPQAEVRLVLNGASITSESTAAIHCSEADALVVTLADGSDNLLQDAAVYSDAGGEGDDAPSGALYSRCDLTLNGEGALTVNGLAKNGIVSKDDIVVAGGSYTIEAQNHGIRGKDSVTVLNATMTIVAGNDGIQSDSTGGEDKGWVTLHDGSYNITAAHDGVQAETALTIYGGSYTLTTGGGSTNAPARSGGDEGPGGFGGGRPNGDGRPDGELPEGFGGDMPDFEMPEGEPPDGFGGGMPDGMTPPDGNSTAGGPGGAGDETAGADENDTQRLSVADASEAETETGGEAAAEGQTADESSSDSYKALKAGGDVRIEGGSFVIDSADDGIHANANVTLAGGSYTIASGDDAVHADLALRISGEPTIDITASYEGLEGQSVHIESGDIAIRCSDDGINAASGDGTGGFGRASEDNEIVIDGGNIEINTSGGDGIDSNGYVTMNGGSLCISGVTNGADSAIDYDGTFLLHGGTVAAFGGTSMAQASSDGSTQPALMLWLDESGRGGAEVQLLDEGGDVLLRYTPEKDYNCMVLSAPGMREGESYTVTAGGETLLSITLTGYLTSVSQSGEAVQGFGGFGGGPGGGQRAEGGMGAGF